MSVNGDASTVIGDSTTSVRENRHVDTRTKSGHGFVDRVIHNFPHKVV
jgi:hypothetical protein